MRPLVERPPVAYIAVVALLVGVGVLFALGVLGALPVDDLYLLFTTYVLVQALAVVFAFIAGLLIGLFLAHRILGSQDFTPFERAVLEGQREIRELLRRREGETGGAAPVDGDGGAQEAGDGEAQGDGVEVEVPGDRDGGRGP